MRKKSGANLILIREREEDGKLEERGLNDSLQPCWEWCKTLSVVFDNVVTKDKCRDVTALLKADPLYWCMFVVSFCCVSITLFNSTSGSCFFISSTSSNTSSAWEKGEKRESPALWTQTSMSILYETIWPSANFSLFFLPVDFSFVSHTFIQKCWCE